MVFAAVICEVIMKRILLAEDEESIQIAYKMLLEGPGVEVQPVDCVQNAKNHLEKEQFEAFIVDLRLQGNASMDGLHLIDYARKYQKTPCYIIVITAYGDKETEALALSAGADLFLEKPLSPINLKNILSSINIYSSAPKSTK
ncbi:response regulator receiver protein [Chitinispirillum alkaliphilum]|nr:response regulator receiver protein [Chitinispirillum alkaliphilum]